MDTQRQAFDDAVLEGDGFRLRPPGLDDVGRVAEACADEVTQHWLPLPRPYGPAEATGFIEGFAVQALREGTGLVRAIETDGHLVGMVDLKNADWRNQTAEVGYWTAPWARRQGYAVRAVTAASRFAFGDLGLRRLYLFHAVENEGSCAVALAAGFRHEGTLRESYRYADGVHHDEHLHGLLARDLGIGVNG